MLIKIDMESEEFKSELKNTKEFTDKICATKGWFYNPIEDINEGVLMGLARNKLIYNKRFCPCFMVIGETEEEQKAADNRVCPCKPAIEKEIPEDGKCHCGIFCTAEYVQKNTLDIIADEIAHNHSRGLTKEECETLLKHPQLDNDEIQSLLEARELKMVDFNLIDVREWMEWKEHRIVGTDYLIPTTTFYSELSQIEHEKDKPTILYCLTGSRSSYCQGVLKNMGWKNVSNYTQGIVTYKGQTESGES